MANDKRLGRTRDRRLNPLVLTWDLKGVHLVSRGQGDFICSEPAANANGVEIVN